MNCEKKFSNITIVCKEINFPNEGTLNAAGRPIPTPGLIKADKGDTAIATATVVITIMFISKNCYVISVEKYFRSVSLLHRCSNETEIKSAPSILLQRI